MHLNKKDNHHQDNSGDNDNGSDKHAISSFKKNKRSIPVNSQINKSNKLRNFKIPKKDVIYIPTFEKESIVTSKSKSIVDKGSLEVSQYSYNIFFTFNDIYFIF